MAGHQTPAVGNQVFVSGKKKVGVVKALLREGQAAEMTAFIVQSGLFKKTLRRVPLQQVKWINDGSVVLELNDHHFAELPEWHPPAEAPAAPAAEAEQPSA